MLRPTVQPPAHRPPLDSVRPRWVATRLIAACIVVTGAVTAWTVNELRGASNSVDQLIGREVESSARSAEVVGCDEVLRMSARLAAATGDAHWIARYDECELRRGDALEASMALAPDRFVSSSTGAIDECNGALIALERRALDWVAQGRVEEASALLASDDYARQEQIYASGMAATRASISRAIQSRTDTLHSQLALARRTSLAGVALLSLVWLVVLGIVRRMTLEQRRGERELVDARGRADSALRAKADFLASMSHEIRTPLNDVVGLSERLASTPLDHEQKQFVQNIRSSSDTLLHVIDDILDYSQVDAGRLDLERLSFDLVTTIEDVGALLAPRAAADPIELVLHVASDVPIRLRGDPTRLKQVLLNLAGNAFAFTSQGEIRIDVKLDLGAPDAPDWTALRIDVADTGIGIPAERMPALFTAFEQVDASSTQRSGGTGLGLALSRKLVQLMGGTITAASILGKGSTFTVQIPFELAPAAAKQAGPPEWTLGSLDGLRVLAVDDHAGARAALAKQLAALGCFVETAASGADALECFAARQKDSKPFDVALLDERMPNMSGAELAQELRRRPGGDKLPIVLFSADPRGVAIDGARIDARLLKPVRRSELARTLARVSDAAARRRDAA